jgi:hypothetical protein
MPLPAESERYFGLRLQFQYKSRAAAKDICQKGQGHQLFISWLSLPKPYVLPSSKDVTEVENATEWHFESLGRPSLSPATK